MCFQYFQTKVKQGGKKSVHFKWRIGLEKTAIVVEDTYEVTLWICVGEWRNVTGEISNNSQNYVKFEIDSTFEMKTCCDAFKYTILCQINWIQV